MRRLVGWVLDGLPFDPRSRRALDETLLDWAHEEASAGSFPNRATTNLRALVGVARAVLVSSLSEIGRVPVGWIALRLGLFAMIPSVALTLLPAVEALRGFGARGMVLGVLLLPGALVVCLPAAVLLALAWRPSGRTFPAVGTAIVVTLATLVLAGWVLPTANQWFGDRVFRLYAPVGPVVGPASYPVHEISLIEIGGRLLGGRRLDVTRIAILLRLTGFAALSGAAVLLARSLARRVAPRSVLWLVTVPGVYLALVGSAAMLARAEPHVRPLGNGVGVWALAGCVLAASMALWRHAGSDNLSATPLT